MIRNEFGKVKRYNNYITKSEKMIKHYTEMKEKYGIKLEGEKETFGKILNLLNPKVNLKNHLHLIEIGEVKFGSE